MKWLPAFQNDQVLPASLGQHQELLAECIMRLYQHAFFLGYQIHPGETTRDPRIAELNAQSGAGILHSLHIDGLAHDIKLFRDGHYYTRSEDYLALGVHWESLHALAAWGGRFSRPDGNHFSIKWQGRR